MDNDQLLAHIVETWVAEILPDATHTWPRPPLRWPFTHTLEDRR